MTLTDFGQIVDLVRDSLLIIILLIMLAAILFTFRKVSILLDSVNRTVKNAEEVSDAISNRIVEPAAAGSGVAFGIGKMMAFLLGLGRRKKYRQKGGEHDGEQ